MCLQVDLTPPSGEKVILNQIKSNRAYIAHFLQLNATQLPLHLITETDPAITSVLHVF